jgi:hypothetical protein
LSTDLKIQWAHCPVENRPKHCLAVEPNYQHDGDKSEGGNQTNILAVNVRQLQETALCDSVSLDNFID